MKPVDPRLLRQAGAARGIGIGALSWTLAWLGVVLAGRAAAATAGRTTLLITHDLDELDQVDQIIVLGQGKGRPARQLRRAQIIPSG